MAFVRIGLGMTVWLEKHCTKHGCQRQGDQTGKNDGRGHRDPKLTIEGSGRPGNERHRNEDGRHHKGDGNDRARDLVHDLRGCHVRRYVLLGHFGVHRLDYHDRVVLPF